ncbi:MAG: hypothetical protein B5M56_04005 [Desulfococcus sp. 4484_241]|nr:MAG: hypothetical protein B5M56_04005 [Desulfococcus sp. 4484_241]
MIDMQPEATITIPVDPYNPGQFFACCGLLELTHRLTQPGYRALGWFEIIDNAHPRFSITAFNRDAPITLEQTISYLKKCKITATNQDSKEGPVILEEPFNIHLDWRSPFPQHNLVKTFTGQQNIFKIVRALQQAMPESCDTELLNARGPVDRTVTAFSVEKAENSIDAGFSMDVQKGRLLREPPVFLEFLALIGVQRFCPRQGKNRLDRIYYAWQNPLPSPLAAIAVSKPLKNVLQKGFIFQMYNRESKGRYKGFAPSRELTQKKEKTHESTHRHQVGQFYSE